MSKATMWSTCLLLVGLDLGSTLDATSAAGSNETNLLSRRAVAAHRRRVADVLMVTTTMRMLHGVHGHTTNLASTTSQANPRSWTGVNSFVSRIRDKLFSAASHSTYAVAASSHGA